MSQKDPTATLCLKVKGTIVVYHSNDKVEIIKVIPPGFNPHILLLEIVVTEGSGPMKGVDRAFIFETTEDAKQYTGVQIKYPDGDIKTIELT